MGDRRLFVRRLLRWGRANRRDFPWRRPGEDAFRILVAELLLQRSRGKTVAKVYEELFGRWPDALSLARARETDIARVIRPLGLTSRARTLKALAAEIAARGAVPGSGAELMELKGVGRYVANATLVAAFGKPAPVVDGVTARVYRRYLGLPNGVAPVSDEDLWKVAGELAPQRAARDWNWAVLDLAAMVCLPKVPRCGECPVAECCTFVTAGS